MAKKVVRYVVRGVLAVLVLVAIGLGVLFARMPRSGPARVEVEPGIVGVQSKGSYVWIVKSATGAVLIDSGMDPAATTVKAELTKMGVKPEDVHNILLTHGHADHIAGLAAFPNAKVLLGHGESGLVLGTERPTALIPGMLGRFMHPPQVPNKLVELRDLHEIPLNVDGLRFYAISIPGHTNGSMMYLYKDILFSGDSLLGSGKGLAPPPSFLSEDPHDSKSMLRNLAYTPFQRVADGHTGLVLDAQAKFKQLFPTLPY